MINNVHSTTRWQLVRVNGITRNRSLSSIIGRWMTTASFLGARCCYYSVSDDWWWRDWTSAVMMADVSETSWSKLGRRHACTWYSSCRRQGMDRLRESSASTALHRTTSVLECKCLSSDSQVPSTWRATCSCGCRCCSIHVRRCHEGGHSCVLRDYDVQTLDSTGTPLPELSGLHTYQLLHSTLMGLIANVCEQVSVTHKWQNNQRQLSKSMPINYRTFG